MGDEDADDWGATPAPAPPSAAFRIERDARVVVHVTGELDALTADALGALLSDAIASSPEAVIVDLRELAFIDSVGLTVLVTAHNQGASLDVPFEVHSVPPSCLRVFEITRLVDVLDLR